MKMEISHTDRTGTREAIGNHGQNLKQATVIKVFLKKYKPKPTYRAGRYISAERMKHPKRSKDRQQGFAVLALMMVGEKGIGIMKGYKAFKKGLVCRGKQYAENTVFEEETTEICESGMHFCQNPLDVLGYYPLVDENGEMSEFAEVEALDKCKTDDNKKYCTKKLKIGAKIGFPQLVQASVKFEWEKNQEDTASKTESSGDYAQIGSSGVLTQIGSSGDYAMIGSSGYSAKIGSSGDCAKIGSSGKYAVVCCAGHGSIVKAKKGSWITLSEWEYDEQEEAYIPVCVKTVQVDGDKIKADTFYKLENCEFVEVNPS